MKKRIIIPALTLTLALACAGCAKQQTTPTTVPTTTPPTTEAVVATMEATTAPTMAETLPEGTEAPTVAETAAPSESAPASTEHKHTYKSKVTKVPTCTASGVRTYTCSECGASYTENINPLDHAYVITVKEPDCNNSGCTTYHCKECGYTYSDNIREALGHSYGPMVTVRNPTELEAGLAERTCTRCGAKDTVVLPKLNPQP